MKKKQKVQIFKLEERVLFDGAAAAEIVAAVNNAGDANNADQADNDSDQDQQDKFVQNTVQNAGPVEMPVPDSNVQNDGEGLPQADAAQNDPAEVLINGSADFTQATDVDADSAADADADSLQVSADLDADAIDHADLIVVDADAADQLDLDVLDGKNVLVLDGDSDAADQIEDWMSDHADQNIDSVLVVSDSDSLDIQLDNAELDTLSVDDFQAGLDHDADADDLVVMPDNDALITVDPDSGDDLPAELTQDADADRHELVIVNSTTADLDNVLEQLGDSREVLVIDSTSDAFEQIADYLDHADTDFDAVHILTHGNDGGVVLGSQYVTDADHFAVFDGHLSADGDILFYGCDLAGSEAGQQFIHDIADVTGADVAASTDITGSADFNGNWTLEYSTGAIDTTAISLDSSWNHRLETYTIGASGTYANLTALTSAVTLADQDVISYVDSMTDTSASLTLDGIHITITTDQTVTIQGTAIELDNGATLTFGGTGELTLKNVTVDADYSAATVTDTLNVIEKTDSGTLNIVGGSMNVTGATSNATHLIANMSGGGTLNINTGAQLELTSDVSDSAVIFNAKDQTVNIGAAGAADGTTITMTGGGYGTSGIFNNGTLNIRNSYVSGDSFGLYNSTDGKAVFRVDVTPDQYLTAADLGSLGTDPIGDFSQLVYGITGSTAVYNQNSFTATGPALSFSGDIDGTAVENVPTAALNGSVQNSISASGAPPVATLSKVTVNGDFSQYGNSKVTMTDVALNGDLSNSLGNVFIAGYFGGTREMKVGTTTASYTSPLFLSNDGATGTFGNVYIGTNGDVEFNPDQSYQFYNDSGTMQIYNFTGLSSKDHPVEITNYGEFFMDSDPKSETAYTLYVTGSGSNVGFGVSNRGIYNENPNGYNATYEIPHRMVLTDLDILNTAAASVAVTNYAGVLTITRGSLQGSYSGIDLLVDFYGSHTTTAATLYAVTPTTTLTNLTKIAGKAYSIRNSGELTMTAPDVEGGTLLTNNTDFSAAGYSYTAVANNSLTLYINEYYQSTDKTYNDYYIYAYTGSQAFRFDWKGTTSSGHSASSLTPSRITLYSMSASDIHSRTQISIGSADNTYTRPLGSDKTQTDWHYGDYPVIAKATLSNIAFQASAGTATNTAIRNWGDLTITGINADSDYRFSGFTISINNGATTFWTSDYAQSSPAPGHTPAVNGTVTFYNHFTPVGDYEVGFNLPGTSVRTSSIYKAEMTLRGVETASGSGLYNGGLLIDGARYVVYVPQTLTLENFSVSATDSDAIFNAGVLNIFNGTGSESTGYTGPSNAVITAEGGAGIVNKGKVRMINGAIVNSEVGIRQESSGLLTVLNSTLYDNQTGIISALKAPSSSEGMNFEVVDTTIVSSKDGSVGIQFTAASQLDLVNSIILVKGGTGIDNSVKAKVVNHGSTNIVGTPDTTANLMQSTYGTDFNGIASLYDANQNVLYLAPNSAATSGGIAVSYTVSSSGVYTFNFGQSKGIIVDHDKGGNARSTEIGSYVLSGSPAPTVTIMVNTLQDAYDESSEVYSLRYMIEWLQSSQNTKGQTTVQFDWEKIYAESTTSELVFQLTEGTLNILSGNEAAITSISIDLTGVDSSHTVKIGNDAMAASVFTVSGMALTVTGSNAGKFSINGSGTNTAAVSANGAAFHLVNAAGTSLTLNNATVTGGNTTGNGGAIYLGGGNAKFTATSAVFSNNAAEAGGAIYNAGTATVNGNFTGNNATLGGAVYNNGGTLTVNGNFSGNTADNGGAIYNAGTATVTGNIANSVSTGDGGAIFNTGKLTVTGNISGSNSTGNGGAIYNEAGTTTVTGTISGSTAGANGGAIYSDGGTVIVLGNITGGSASEGSVAYVNNGRVQLGDLDHYISLTGNSGNIVTVANGEAFIANALVKDNGTDGNTLFAVNGGGLTILNSTVTGNKGDLLSNSGTVQIGDSTIAFNADSAQITGSGTLNVLNSIVVAANDFTVTAGEGNVINPESLDDIFILKDGKPAEGSNGTLIIRMAGPAARDGVMVGYKTDAGVTTLYYTTDGENWQTADGAAATVSGITSVTKAQNETDRLYSGYDQLSIGAYSLNATALSLVVTISGDESVEGETTLRDALEYASYLYATTGEARTVTFKVSEVNLDSTITISCPVSISGDVTISTTGSFSGDTVFAVKGDSDVTMSHLKIVGKAGVRGITVNSGNLFLGGVTVRDANVSGNGGAIYIAEGSLAGHGVRLINNQAADGAAVYSENAEVELSSVTLKGNTATAGSIITTKLSEGNDLTLMLQDGFITGNTASANIINASGATALISVTAVDNTMGNALLKAPSADILNSSLTGNPDDGFALVDVSGDLNVANSIILSKGTSVDAGTLNSAYSIYSGKPDFGVNVENQTGRFFTGVFTGAVENGKLVIDSESPAAMGVWTEYDSATRAIIYSVRPENVWTANYSPAYMQWRYLGGGSAGYDPTLLVGSQDAPSIGAYWLTGRKNLPDQGPGVNTGMIDPSFNGGFGTDWGYNSVVNGYWRDPQSSLSTEADSGMGWYATMLADLFGYRSSQTGNIAVSGAVPGEELDLSVDGVQQDFNEFQEAPYRVEDGSPLSPAEQADLLKSITLNRRQPEDSLNLSEAVHQQVASSLRSAELFKDNFDKALESLLGQDA